MHISSVSRIVGASFVVAAMACLSVAGPIVGSLIADDAALRQERDARRNAFQEAVGQAARTVGEGRTVQELRTQGEEQKLAAEQAIVDIGQRKRQSRLELAGAVDRLTTFRDHFEVDPQDPAAMQEFIAVQQERFASGLRWYGAYRLTDISRTHASVLPRVLVASLADRAQEFLYERTVQDARLSVITLAEEMSVFPNYVAGLQADHDALIAEYHAALNDYDAAERMIALSDARQEQIKRIAAEVEQRIRDMQTELAQYDERIRQRAESDLISLGLLSERRRGGSATPTFIWPAVGRITANFLDEDYESFFGIPHKAVDIAQAQGSIVRSSADGVVHYVQHGGATGYSYILIGHRDGFATLYGHMFEIHVQPGDDVYQGEVIGLSGGQPGTVGAGPMTTGSHVHFEVIHDGVHIDPLTVLP